MSNSTRPGGYDERLVVPLEASRRGAHRARTNPLVAALPLLAVIVVVAAVIGVAYALFLKPPADQTAGDQGATTTSSPGPTNNSPASSSKPSTTPPPSNSASSPGTSSSAPAATVNKNIAITVYNGTTISGLAKRASSALVATGFKNANVTTDKWAPAPSGTRVFYSKQAQQATAEAVAKALKVGRAEKTTQDTGAGIAVVAGADADTVIPG